MSRAALLALALGVAAGAANASDLFVTGDVVHVVSGPSLKDGAVLVHDGKIVAVGPASVLAVPDGAKRMHAAVVTPGLIDAHCVVGLTGYLNQDQDQDQLDRSAAIQPELRAIDSYDARERLIEWLRGFGVTTVHSGHAPGALVSGQTLIAKLRGGSVEEAVIVPEAMIAATLGEGAQMGEGKSPGTRSKAVAMLRAELIKAQAYSKKQQLADATKRPDRDLKMEALARVLAGTTPLLVTAQRHQDVDAALRLREEFGFRLVLDGAAEGLEIAPRIRAAGVPVIANAPMARMAGEMENASFHAASRWKAAGIPFALQGGYEEYVPKVRVILFEAAVAAAHGLGEESALKAITLDAAKILGVDGRIGSLEAGKDADLALYDGDPFEYVTHCVGTVIDGEVVFEGAR